MVQAESTLVKPVVAVAAVQAVQQVAKVLRFKEAMVRHRAAAAVQAVINM
jgi:hypothetical protein